MLCFVVVVRVACERVRGYSFRGVVHAYVKRLCIARAVAPLSDPTPNEREFEAHPVSRPEGSGPHETGLGPTPGARPRRGTSMDP